MRKFLAALLLLTIAAVLAVPAGVGWYVEKTVHEQLTVIKNNPNIAIEALEYKRGWLTTNAKFRITALGKSGDATVESVIKLHHGPLPISALWNDNSQFSPAALLINASAKATEINVTGIAPKQTTKPLTLTGLLGLQGTFSYRCQHAGGALQFTRPGQKAASLSWQPGSCSGNAPITGGVVTGAVSLSALQFNDGLSRLQLGESTFDYTVNTETLSTKQSSDSNKTNSQSTLLASVRWFVSSLQGTVKRGQHAAPINLNNATLAATGNRTGNTLAIDTNLQLPELESNQLQLADGKLDFQLAELPASVLSGNTSGLLQAAKLNIREINAAFPEGEFQASGKANLRGMAADAPLSLESVLAGLDSQLKLKIAEPLLHSLIEQYAVPEAGQLWYASTTQQRRALKQQIRTAAEQQISELLQSGLIEQAEGQYVSRIRYANSRIKVNSQTLQDKAGGR